VTGSNVSATASGDAAVIVCGSAIPGVTVNGPQPAPSWIESSWSTPELSIVSLIVLAPALTPTSPNAGAGLTDSVAWATPDQPTMMSSAIEQTCALNIPATANRTTRRRTHKRSAMQRELPSRVLSHAGRV
jgi:hypothetical protein